DGENAELDEHIRLLTEAGHPVYTIHLQDAYALGGEFLRWEFATAVAGKFFGINPFDEPDVTSAKKITNEFLKRYQEVGKLSDEKAFFTEDNVSLYVDDRIAEMLSSISNQCHFDSSQLEGLLAAHISLARSGNYIGLLAYLA